MADTSGAWLGNNLGNDRFIYVNWQVAAQEIGNNRTLINWQAYARFTNADNQLDNGRVDSNVGNLWYNGGRVKNFTGVVSGTRNVALASGSFWVGHDAAGNGSVQFGGGIDYYGTGRSQGTSGVWTLPTIPRHAVMNSADNFNDEANPAFNYSNPAGTGVDFYLETPSLGGSGFAGRNLGSGGGGTVTLTLTTTERNTLRARMANVNSTTVRFVVHDTLGGSDSWSYVDRTVTIVNGNPTFTDFTYKDTATAVVAITGSDQVILQGKSTVRATVSAANKMTPLKSSTAVNYMASLDGVVDTEPYSASAAVDLDLGSLASNGVKALTVKATDSRGNSTTVSKDLNVIPYASPVLNVTATRLNGFEAATTVKINGTFSRVTVVSTDKNSIKASTLRYRLQQDGGTWSSWVIVTPTQSAGAFNTTDIILSLVNSSQFNLQVEVQDQFETVTSTVLINRGIPIMMISDNKEAIGINKMPDGSLKGLYLNPTDNLFNQVYPIGSIYMSVNSTNPSTFFGGTWAAWGTGRVPVGIDTSQTEFNTIEKTGGHKLLQSHRHELVQFGVAPSAGGYPDANGFVVGGAGTDRQAGGRLSNYVGGGNAENLQPYITTYMWKRTA